MCFTLILRFRGEVSSLDLPGHGNQLFAEQGLSLCFVRPRLLTPEGSPVRKEPGGFSAPGCGGLPSGLVKLLAGSWGARLLRLGFPQVVVAEVALEALELGIVMVGCGVAVRAAGLWQVVSAEIPI